MVFVVLRIVQHHSHSASWKNRSTLLKIVQHHSNSPLHPKITVKNKIAAPMIVNIQRTAQLTSYGNTGLKYNCRRSINVINSRQKPLTTASASQSPGRPLAQRHQLRVRLPHWISADGLLAKQHPPAGFPSTTFLQHSPRRTTSRFPPTSFLRHNTPEDSFSPLRLSH